MIAPNNEITTAKAPSTRPTIGIIDDDPIAATVMRARLAIQFPQCAIEIYDQPIVTPMLNVYFIDNDFNGHRLATKLLKEIRQTNPNALVVAMSSTLENDTLKALINGGCNAVYDKNQPSNCDPVFEVIGNYINVLEQLEVMQQRNRFSSIAQSLRGLLQEWNTRLGKAGL